MENLFLGNALLARMERKDISFISSKCRETVIKIGSVLPSSSRHRDCIYFPCGEAILSLRTVLSPKLAVECGSIGSEGAWPVGRIDWSNILVKVFRGDRFLRIDIRTFEEVLRQSPSIREAVEKYSAGLMNTTMQLAACNTAHSVDQRLARWLLQMTDQAETNLLYPTHEEVASTLGIGRSYATRILAKFSALGAVRSRRGSVEITNSNALRGVSCGCEARMRREVPVSLPTLPKPPQFREISEAEDSRARL